MGNNKTEQPELEPELKLISTGVTHIYSTGAPVAQPEPEPYGYFKYDIRLDAWVQNRVSNSGVAFYTTPPQRKEWQGLTDEDLSVCDEDGVILVRYWEAKLKEKNT